MSRLATTAAIATAVLLALTGCGSPPASSMAATGSARVAVAPAPYQLAAVAHKHTIGEIASYTVSLQVADANNVYASAAGVAPQVLDPRATPPQTTASYPSLSPGKYRVLVTAKDAGSVTLNATPASADFNLTAGAQASASVSVQLDDTPFKGTATGALTAPTLDGVFTDPAATEAVGP